MKVVVDAGPIIALAKTGHLALLPQLFDEVSVPERVMAEVSGPGEGRPGAEIANANKSGDSSTSFGRSSPRSSPDRG